MSDEFEPTRPKIFNHLLKAAVLGSLAGMIIFLAVIVAQALDSIYQGLYALIAWPFLAGAVRNVQALLIRPHLRLSRQGIKLRYWRAVGIPSFAMFRPSYRVVDCDVPWQEYAACRTYTHTLNLIPTWKALIIDTKAASHVIGWDHFRGGVSKLQLAILDYFEMEFRQPGRQRLNIPEFCRRRFRTPLRIVAKRDGRLLAVGSSALAGVSVAAIWWCVPDFPDTNWLILPAVLLVGTWAGLRINAEVKGRKVLELTADGLSVGDGRAAAKLVSWEDILFVRKQTNADYSLFGKRDKPCTTALEIRLRDHSSLVLHRHYSRGLDEIQELMDPPPEKLEQVPETLSPATSQPRDADAGDLRGLSRPEKPAPAGPEGAVPPGKEAGVPRRRRGWIWISAGAAAVLVVATIAWNASRSLGPTEDRVAASLGNHRAQYLAGMRDLEGNKPSRSRAEAARLIKEAADSGYPAAEFQYALLSRWGLGVPQSRPETLRWLAAAGGHDVVEAQFMLGSMAFEEDPKDPVLGEKWLGLAAGNGCQPAAYMLAMKYIAGTDLQEDYVKAYLMLLKAGSTKVVTDALQSLRSAMSEEQMDRVHQWQIENMNPSN